MCGQFLTVSDGAGSSSLGSTIPGRMGLSGPETGAQHEAGSTAVSGGPTQPQPLLPSSCQDCFQERVAEDTTYLGRRT